MDSQSDAFPATQPDDSFCSPTIASQMMQRSPIARLLSENPKFRTVEIFEDTREVRFGRKPGLEVEFDLKYRFISAVHCRVFSQINPKTQQREFFVQDFSSNGTYINDQKMKKGTCIALQDGDHIAITRPRISPYISYVFHDTRARVEGDKLDAIFQKYRLVEEIGRGNFSVVKKAYNLETGEAVAVKIINKRKLWTSPQTEEATRREVEILKRLNHPNIIRYIDIYDCPQNLYIVLELATGGELFNRIVNCGPIPEPEARRMFYQMVDAVRYLHQQGVAHRDLKPENILLSSDGTIKISDFGLARIADHRYCMTTLCGTPQYVAPEIIKLGTYDEVKNSVGGYNVAVDMWSLGVILYILLSGCPPFDESLNRQMSLYQQIETGTYSLPPQLFSKISSQAIDLIKKLLQVDPAQRLTAEQALQHPWLASLAPTKIPIGEPVQSDPAMKEDAQRETDDSMSIEHQSPGGSSMDISTPSPVKHRKRSRDRLDDKENGGNRRENATFNEFEYIRKRPKVSTRATTSGSV